MLPFSVGCGGGGDRYVPVTGTVKYDEGSLIPAEMLQVTFEPVSEERDVGKRPRPGMVYVDVTDGTFGKVTSSPTAAGRGIEPGKHKVLVRAFDEHEQLMDVVPIEYSDVATTPLEVDTARTNHFDLKIRRPDK
jgi:hypothetical protein